MSIAAGRISATVKDYLSLTKPRVILLHLIVAAVAAFLAAGGSPSTLRLGLTLIGGAFAAAGANALNCYLDRDLDAKMQRTCFRPLPQGRLKPSRALFLGLLCCAAGIAVFRLASPLAAALAAGAIFYYLVVYTLWQKRSTPISTIIGGVAGALPPLIAWAAVTGGLGLSAGVLSLIIFLWTPPHFWALALTRRDDYARAGVPVLSNASAGTRLYILLFILALAGASLAFAFVSHRTPFYLGSAALLNLSYLYLAYRLFQRPEEQAQGLYRFSSLYLALLFAAMLVDLIFFAG